MRASTRPCDALTRDGTGLHSQEGKALPPDSVSRCLVRAMSREDRWARLWRQVGQVGPNVGSNVGISGSEQCERTRESGQVQESLLEAATGVEPVIKVLQT